MKLFKGLALQGVAVIVRQGYNAQYTHKRVVSADPLSGLRIKISCLGPTMYVQAPYGATHVLLNHFSEYCHHWYIILVPD